MRYRQYEWDNEVPQSPTIGAERSCWGVKSRSIRRRKACGAGGDVMNSDVKPMRLSEAIRLGAMMKPQAFGVLVDDDNGGTCALGAAYDAVGIKFDASGIPNGYLGELDLWLRRIVELQAATCPACGVNTPAIGLIPHLNDTHRWTRQRIAEFVELYEPIPESAESAVNGRHEQRYETLRAAVRDADVVLAVNKEIGELSILWGKPLLEAIRDFDQADECKVVQVPIDLGEDCDDLEQLAALVQVERGTVDLVEEFK
jgi:hypothetical protein